MWGGIDTAFDYSVIRSARRTLCLEIGKEGVVIVRAPQRTSEQAISSFVEKHTAWVERHRARVLAREEAHRLTPAQEAELRRRAKEILPARTAHFAALMGVTPTGISVTSAQKRFGSCSPRNSICFSFRLMQYPDDAIDYVIVHELAHIRHHDHSPAFYAEIALILPDWKRRAAMLKE